MSWRSSPEDRRAMKQAWYAERRAKGLCVNCSMPSVRFSRCSCCRELLASSQKAYDERRREKYSETLNARARARYAETRGTVRPYHSRLMQRRYYDRRYRATRKAA